MQARAVLSAMSSRSRLRRRIVAAHWRLLSGTARTVHGSGLSKSRALTVEPNRSDFPRLLGRCQVSVSQAGYNTVLDILRARCRAVVVPYAEAGQLEQGLRAQALAQAQLERGAGQLVAASICYEDVFGSEQLHYLPDSTLLVNVSNDAWFGDSIAPHQHLQIARVRAAEAGRYMPRATNTGVSGIIDPAGGLIAISPQFEPHVLRATVRGYSGTTPYVRWGNYAVVIACLLVLFGQFLTTKFTIRPGT